MALLIIELDKRIGDANAWRETFKQQLPDLPIRFWPEAGEPKDIEYLAFMHPDFDSAPRLPEPESHVQPLGRSGGFVHPTSKACRRPHSARWSRQAAIQ